MRCSCGQQIAREGNSPMKIAVVCAGAGRLSAAIFL
jgi:hypothetical protein